MGDPHDDPIRKMRTQERVRACKVAAKLQRKTV